MPNRNSVVQKFRSSIQPLLLDKPKTWPSKEALGHDILTGKEVGHQIDWGYRPPTLDPHGAALAASTFNTTLRGRRDDCIDNCTPVAGDGDASPPAVR